LIKKLSVLNLKLRINKLEHSELSSLLNVHIFESNKNEKVKKFGWQ